jgi:hypothetical protein
MTLSFLLFALHGLLPSLNRQASCKNVSIDSLRDEIVLRLERQDSSFFRSSMEPGAEITWWKDSICGRRERYAARMDCHRTTDSIAYLHSRGSLRYRLRNQPSGWVLDRTFACVPTEVKAIIDDLMRHVDDLDEGYVASFLDSSLAGQKPFKTLGFVLHSGIGSNARTMCSMSDESHIRITAPQCDAPHWVHHPVFDFSKRDGHWHLDRIWVEPSCR